MFYCKFHFNDWIAHLILHRWNHSWIVKQHISCGCGFREEISHMREINWGDKWFISDDTMKWISQSDLYTAHSGFVLIWECQCSLINNITEYSVSVKKKKSVNNKSKHSAQRSPQLLKYSATNFIIDLHRFAVTSVIPRGAEMWGQGGNGALPRGHRSFQPGVRGQTFPHKPHCDYGNELTKHGQME